MSLDRASAKSMPHVVKFTDMNEQLQNEVKIIQKKKHNKENIYKYIGYKKSSGSARSIQY